MRPEAPEHAAVIEYLEGTHKTLDCVVGRTAIAPAQLGARCTCCRTMAHGDFKRPAEREADHAGMALDWSRSCPVQPVKQASRATLPCVRPMLLDRPRPRGWWNA